MEKTTPLYDCHVAAGGKIVPFGGYLLPVQYETGVTMSIWRFAQPAGCLCTHMGELCWPGRCAAKCADVHDQ